MAASSQFIRRSCIYNLAGTRLNKEGNPMTNPRESRTARSKEKVVIFLGRL